MLTITHERRKEGRSISEKIASAKAWRLEEYGVLKGLQGVPCSRSKVCMLRVVGEVGRIGVLNGLCVKP